MLNPTPEVMAQKLRGIIEVWGEVIETQEGCKCWLYPTNLTKDGIQINFVIKYFITNSQKL